MAQSNTPKNIKIIADEFRCFHKSGQLLSSHHNRIINKFPGQWIAVYDGKVLANNSDFNTVLSQIDTKHIPRELTVIRFIAKKKRSMIL